MAKGLADAAVKAATASPPCRNLATPPEVAAYLGVPVKTLAEWRSQGKGPEWRKVGRHARYRWESVESWLDRQQGGGEAA